MEHNKPGKWSITELCTSNPIGEPPVRWTWLASGEHSTVNLVESNGINAPHVHDYHDETLYVIEGEGSILLGEETHPLAAGDVVFIPAGTVHTPIIAGTERTLSVYAPPFDPEHPDRRYVYV